MKVEKNLELLLEGLVDGVRVIYNDLALRGIARETMLCVSGSGLERVIDIILPF
jgi:hypothetical protein